MRVSLYRRHALATHSRVRRLKAIRRRELLISRSIATHAFALLAALALVAPAADADRESKRWASKVPVGSQMPEINAKDHLGNDHTLATLSGQRGFLLLFNRSSDW